MMHDGKVHNRKKETSTGQHHSSGIENVRMRLQIGKPLVPHVVEQLKYSNDQTKLMAQLCSAGYRQFSSQPFFSIVGTPLRLPVERDRRHVASMALKYIQIYSRQGQIYDTYYLKCYCIQQAYVYIPILSVTDCKDQVGTFGISNPKLIRLDYGVFFLCSDESASNLKHVKHLI